MKDLLKEIRSCRICEDHLPLGPNPVLRASSKSRILIVGQAPGIRVHESGIPWNDPSGDRLREWMGISKDEFYNEEEIAIIPMAFCYPGTGKHGDLPPRKECALAWHQKLRDELPNIKLSLLVGQYAQQYYLGNRQKKNLTETVRHFEEYLPEFAVLPHPSPRNNIWLKKNPWFEVNIIPLLQERLSES